MRLIILSLILVGMVPAYQAHTAVSDEQQQDPSQQANQANTDELPRGKATLYGLYSERGKGWTSNSEDSSTGKLIRNPTLEFAEQTDRIPLRKGVVFGYKYWLKIEPEKTRAELKRVLMHPEMTLPDGSKASRSERNIRKRTTHGIITSLDAYALTEDYELVEGEWTFQLWYGDKLLVEQTFTTYWPEESRLPVNNNLM